MLFDLANVAVNVFESMGPRDEKKPSRLVLAEKLATNFSQAPSGSLRQKSGYKQNDFHVFHLT